jgi:hypothetical protein
MVSFSDMFHRRYKTLVLRDDDEVIVFAVMKNRWRQKRVEKLFHVQSQAQTAEFARDKPISPNYQLYMK